LYKYGGILIGLDQSQRLGRTLGASLQLDWTTGLDNWIGQLDEITKSPNNGKEQIPSLQPL
jgi:hypothetical protein